MRLRTRLVCHYCGRKSRKSKLDGDRFECESCGSLNVFDANGDLVDVTPDIVADASANSPTQYAAPSSFPFPQNDIFCSVCVKNQYLYTTALSQFLPDPDDPNYSQLEAAVPKFKESLEQRYPQCCAQCEPKVKAQLQQATYQAKSDHIRRVLERSKQQRLFASRFGWRSLVVSAAAVLYFVSLFVQLAWHATGLSTIRDALPQSLAECVPGRGRLPAGCLRLIEPYVGWSILLAVLCSWWNPKWQHKLGRKEGRLAGLGEYYQLQLVILATRFCAWTWCVDPARSQNSDILHTVSLATILALSVWAMLIVRVDTTPLVNWDYRMPNLVSNNQFVPLQPPEPLSNEPGFNVMSLAPPTEPDLTPWRPPTPPVETDEMDWQPSQRFDPPKQIQVKNAAPSPFYGTLPSLSGPAPRHQQKQAIGIAPGHFDRRDPLLPARKSAENAKDDVMVEPRFFAPSNDTGLEAIFDQVFSLNELASSNDRPTHTSTTTQNNSPTAQSETVPLQPQSAATGQSSETPSVNYQALLFATFLLLALLLWAMADNLKAAMPNLRLYIISAALAHCLAKLVFTTTGSSTTTTALTTRIILSVEILALIGLGSQFLRPTPTPTPTPDPIGALYDHNHNHIHVHNIGNTIGGGLLTILMGQEVLLYLDSRQRRSP